MPLELLTTIEDYTQEQLEKFLSTLREKRAFISRVFRRSQTRAKHSSSAELRLKLDKLNIKLEKALLKADKALDQCETYTNEVIAIRLQYRDVSPDQIFTELNEDETL